MRAAHLLVAGLTMAGLTLAAPMAATAQPKPDPRVASEQLAAPFNLAVNGDTVYVADGFANMVATLGPNGSLVPVALNQPGAAGVATSSDGSGLVWTTTVTDMDTFTNTASGLHLWVPGGGSVYADTFAYETAHNPDQVNHYGLVNPNQCALDAFAAMGIPASYTGVVDSHAYSVAALGHSWVVADAGANALWKVSSTGDISTLAVLPPQPTVITADAAAALQLPDCAVGLTYNFEPVPTDVEVGRDGMLYVTTLPGGPESDVLGARGALWKVNPNTGAASKLAGGFLGATNLAIDKSGQIFVAEYFAGRITLVKASGKKSHYLDLPNVVAVESGANGSLWAGTTMTLDPTQPQMPGTIVKIKDGVPMARIALR
jgi:hypothetical protein